MNDSIKQILNSNSNTDNMSSSHSKTQLSSSALSTVDSINNNAVAKLQKGNYMEARKIFVSGLDILKDCHSIQILQQQEEEKQRKEEEAAAAVISVILKPESNTTTLTTAATATATATAPTCTTTTTTRTRDRCEGIVSVPITRASRHFECIINENDDACDDDECNDCAVDEESCTENLSRCEYYDAVFILPSASKTPNEHIPDYNEVLAVFMYNVALTYQKEGINGRSASYRKAIFLYRRITTLVKRCNLPDIDENKCQALLLVVLASFHNLGYIYKELGQPSLYRSILEAGIVLERKLHTMNTVPKLQPHDRQFFAMNRFFSRYSEHACAQAA